LSAGMCALFLLRDDLSAIILVHPLPNPSTAVDRPEIERKRTHGTQKHTTHTAHTTTQNASEKQQQYNPMMRPKNNNIH
jgi:hypothetical protein